MTARRPLVIVSGRVQQLATGDTLSIGVREGLTANRTYYVRTDGSDSNTGLVDSAGGAFLTVQKAWDTICDTLDLLGWTVTIQVRSGTFTAGIFTDTQPIGGSVLIQGDTSTPSNVVINGAQSVFRFTAALQNPIRIQGFKLTASGNLAPIYLEAPGIISVDKIEFGAVSSGEAHIRAIGAGAVILVIGVGTGASITISGGSFAHVYANFGARIDISYATYTISGTPNFTGSFARADFDSIINANASTTFSGSATGQRYMAERFSIIFTGGGGANFFPGNSAGSTGTAGYYG